MPTPRVLYLFLYIENNFFIFFSFRESTEKTVLSRFSLCAIDICIASLCPCFPKKIEIEKKIPHRDTSQRALDINPHFSYIAR